MIDIHCHLLPAVDDGPRTMADAVQMARLAREDGIDTIVVTPHQRHENWPNEDRDRLIAAFDELREAVGDTPRLLLGAEVAVDSELLDDLAAPRNRAYILPLAGTRHLLIEFPWVKTATDPRSLVHELLLMDYVPIVAHPERISWLASDPATMRALVDRGALVQITAMSVTGAFGRRAQAACDRLLEEGLVHFVASDAHGATSRPPAIAAAFARIAERHGERTAASLRNPAFEAHDAIDLAAACARQGAP